jgi:peptide/nickel transport system substrate-binding protein
VVGVAACGGVPSSRSTPEVVGPPERGGQLTHALPIENPDGYCLPESELGSAGIIVARALFDTLVQPNERGEFVPYLAESITPDEDFDRWTVRLRPGVVFHDGSALTATVVKNNIDAFRGVYPGRVSLLGATWLEPIAGVDVTDPLTVVITTRGPWVSLPAALHMEGRFGIMAQAQLDDPATCATQPIGTGPFVFREWVPNNHLFAEANPDYWQVGMDGQALPYVDSIDFRPIHDPAQQLNALLAGEVDLSLVNAPPTALLLEQLRAQGQQGTVKLVESNVSPEVGYVILNASRPPFNDLEVRRAFAAAIDRDRLNQVRNAGILQPANGPFGPGNMGYLDETDYPAHDPELARRLIAEYEARTGEALRFGIHTPGDADSVAEAQLLQDMAEQAGAEVELVQLASPAELIGSVIDGDFHTALFRNHPGGDPDSQYIWWKSDSPLQWGRYTDPVIDELLERGRTATSREDRVAAYEDLNRRFAEQLWNLWTFWSTSAMVADPDVHGIGAPLPDGSAPFRGLTLGTPLAGIWIDR